jgi:hypothetical protein
VPGTHTDTPPPRRPLGTTGGTHNSSREVQKHAQNPVSQHVVNTQVKHSEQLPLPLYHSLYAHNTLIDHINPSEKHRGVTQPVWYSSPAAENTQKSHTHFTSQNEYKHDIHVGSDVKHA